MRVTLFCMALVCATAFAVVPHGETIDVGIIEEGVAQSVPSLATDLLGHEVEGEYIPPLDHSTLADPHDPSSSMEYSTPLERALEQSSEDDPYYIVPVSDWNDDILIYPGAVGEGVDFASDPTNNDLYAVFDTDHSTGDSLVVYKSTDGGATWSYFSHAFNTDGSVSNPCITVAQAGGSVWVVYAGIWNETSTNVLWSTRITTSGGGFSFDQVCDNAGVADIASDLSTSAYAYVTWAEDDADMDIRAARNALGGSGWVNNSTIFVNPETPPYPRVSAGAGGAVSVGFIQYRAANRDDFRIKRSTNYGSTYLGSEEVSANTGEYELTWLDIGHSTVSGTVWMIAEWAASTDNLAYYYSTDTGVSWTYGTVIGHVDDEKMPRIGIRHATGSATLAYDADTGNMCMFSYTSASSPTGWSTPEQINDPSHYNTSNFPPAAGWSSSYSAVMFASYNNNYSAYFDWWGNTGIAGESTAPMSVAGLQNSPNPFFGTTRIDFSLTGSGPVSLEVFDVSGRLVSTPIDGQNLEAGDHTLQWDATSFSPGVYFCKLTAGGQNTTQRMVLMR